jgi:transposase, IS5 family
MNLTQFFVNQNIPANKFLEDAEQMIDWDGIVKYLSKTLKYKKGGRPPYKLKLMLKLHLLQMWYGLSDEQCEFQAKDRLSFRKFLELDIDARVPDATTIENFRHKLAEINYCEFLVKYIDECCIDNGLIKKEGSLVDATFIKANSRPHSNEDLNSDIDAKWGHKGFGYKATVNVDKESKLIRKTVVSPNNVAERSVLEEVLTGDEIEVFADKGYDGREIRISLRNKGIKPRIMSQTRRSKAGQPAKPLTLQKEEFNRSCAKIRARVEHVFAWWKGIFKATRTRYRGLERVNQQMQSLTIAYNLRRIVWILRQNPQLSWAKSA